MEVAVGSGVLVRVGCGVAVGGGELVGATVVVGARVGEGRAAISGNSVVVGTTGAFAVAKTAGTLVPIVWTLAAAVAPQGCRVASSCTATVEIAAATSSRVQAV